MLYSHFCYSAICRDLYTFIGRHLGVAKLHNFEMRQIMQTQIHPMRTVAFSPVIYFCIRFRGITLDRL